METEEKKWYRHDPTGNICYTRNESSAILLKGSVLSEAYDKSSREAISRESVDEFDAEDGVTTRDMNFFTMERLDFVVTGTDPTPESIALWRPITGPDQTTP